MVGFAIVSHGENLAKGVVELTSIMAPSTRVTPVGGMDDGDFGTNSEKIRATIESIYSDDGILVLVGLGSAVMTTGTVIKILEEKRVEAADCPLVEDTVIATIDIMGGMNFEGIKTALTGVGKTEKF